MTLAPVLHVGVDTGGTFTDLVVMRDGRIGIAKVPSTPPNFEHGIIAAVDASGVQTQDISFFAHGTTVATNALISKSGARTALVTTKGFRDVLELRRHDRGDLYDIGWDPPEPLVERRSRLEVSERVNYAGDILLPLDEREAQTIVERISADGYEAVAIVFLHSYAAPANERKMRHLVEAAIPAAYVVDSSSLLAEEQEFERTATTVANAYLGPLFRGYISRLVDNLAAAGYPGKVFVMHSGGGLLPAPSMGEVPVRTVMSGPAAGVVAAAEIAARADRLDVITIDMGGTSADIATIRDGQVHLRREYTPEFGLPIRFPTIDLVTVGAGGGSIAWIDQAGSPKVGPQSAGALPGPASYGHGGTSATVTDANLVLGRLCAESPLAGILTLDLELAQRAVAAFGLKLGLSVIEAAEGIVRLANSNMARLVRVMTVERGLDPRDFTLFAFGGAGPMHAVELAQALKLSEILVPPYPGVTAALGLLFADVIHDYSATLVQPETAVDQESLARGFEALEQRGTAALASDGFAADTWCIERMVDVRYAGQLKALTLDAEPLLQGDFAAVRARFYADYQQRYQYVAKDLALEIAAIRVRARVALSRPTLTKPVSAAAARSSRQRPVWFAGSAHAAAIVERASLKVGDTVEGPAVVEQEDTTTVLPPGCVAHADQHGNLRIHIADRDGSAHRGKGSR